MKILNWMQNKVNGRQTNKRPSTKMGLNHFHSIPDVRKDEFSDWPDGLLAIGTFGNNQLSEDLERCESSERSYDLSDFTSSKRSDDLSDFTSSKRSDDLSDFTSEEVSKLQMELAKMLKLKPAISTSESDHESVVLGGKASLPLVRFLNCPSSLEVDRRTNGHESSKESNERSVDDLPRSTSVVRSKGKDVRVDSKNTIGKSSVSFLLKKVFACQGGFTPTPSLKDPIPESRVEKILRSILHRKIYPKSSTRASVKKYLGSRHDRSKTSDDEDDQSKKKASDGCKWVKTDSDFIVLEI